ncbi:MAG: ECF transporter S component [Lachnospiraceae bacterium]|nr:ECF transporter S component [Lachnospiraceae bacterium]
MSEWLEKRGKSLESIREGFASNAATAVVFVGVIVGLILIAILAEKLIDKKNGDTGKKNESYRIGRMTTIGMLSAIAIILNLFSFPLWFAPSFYKIDFSELPVIIGTLALGPVAGVTIETVKIVLNLVLNGTNTAFVGEIANFVMGCAFVVPAGIIYYCRKNKKTALIGLIIATVFSVTAGSLLNAFVLLPAYAQAFGMPVQAFIDMGAALNSGIKSMTSFILLAVVPFNFIKYGLVSLMTMLIYKPISKVIKK